MMDFVIARSASDEAIQLAAVDLLDCFASRANDDVWVNRGGDGSDVEAAAFVCLRAL